ncbi:Serine carboxypeptidase-like 40 [Ancistrocladus abbreviatus]
MEASKACLVLQISLTIIFSFVFLAQGHGHKTQSSALGHLYNRKYFQRNVATTTTTKMVFDQMASVEEDDHENSIHNKVDFNQRGLKEKDRIDRLPGQPPVKFAQYGGYVTVDKAAGRAFYYYFVEAQKSPQSSPLLLWLNGGPGCSSLAYGAMEELGPLRVHSDGKTLYRNNFAWNHGFSYSNRSSDYSTNGDAKTARDNNIFLLNWLERFPEYKKRDFFISGESYAGHYVPQLAQVILQHNKKAKKNIINLRGIIIGNAVINDETDTKGMYEYYWTHALISDQVNEAIMKDCDFSPDATTQNNVCNQASSDAYFDTNGLDIYNIYAPICLNPNLTATPKMPTDVIDPCSDTYVHAYLNTPEVQKALHANVTNLNYDWEPCSDVINNWGDSPSTIIPILHELMANGIRVWVFSGDTDGRIPVTSTRNSLNIMGLKLKTKWYPWFIKGEVGGYAQIYEEGLTFVTVRGAGHQVPSYQPLRALALIKHFLDGTPLSRPPTKNVS